MRDHAHPAKIAKELLARVEQLQRKESTERPRRYLVGLAGIPGSGKVSTILTPTAWSYARLTL